MPRRFSDKRTERFAAGARVPAFTAIERQADRRLQFLLNIESLDDIRAMPGGWRLESLQGNRQGQWSIRINDQWRICFVWDDERGQAVDVEITDYHR